jgi:hypothetical protein
LPYVMNGFAQYLRHIGRAFDLARQRSPPSPGPGPPFPFYLDDVKVNSNKTSEEQKIANLWRPGHLVILR